MTKNLKLFALFCFVWSVPFFAVLNWALYDLAERKATLISVCVIYSLGFSLVGHYLGKRDSQRAVRYSLGARYGLTSALVALAVGSIWILGWRAAWWPAVAVYAAIGALILTAARLLNHRAIKGVRKERLFK